MYSIETNEILKKYFENIEDLELFIISINNEDIMLFSKYLEDFNIPPNFDFGFLLFYSIFNKKYKITYYLLKNQLIEANVRNNLAIRLAARMDNFDLIKYLSSFKNVKTSESYSWVLIIACENNNFEIINFILEQKKDLNVNFKNYKAFNVASKNNNIDILKILDSKTKISNIPNDIILKSILLQAHNSKSYNVLNFVFNLNLNFNNLDRKSKKTYDKIFKSYLKNKISNF